MVCVMFRRMFSALYKKVDPYRHVDVTVVPDDCKGWGSEDPFLDDVIKIVQPQVILEIGSWKGASAIHMGRCVRREGLATEIICADPHVGSAGLWLNNPTAMHMTQKGECGTYDILLANVKRAGLTDIITPFRATSSVATAIMQQQNIKADIVYIDGSHDRIDVEADLHHSLKTLQPDGVIICDDYDHPRLKGVTVAVENFLNCNRHFNMAASRNVDVGLYTEKIVGMETGKKCVLLRQGSRFANSFC